MINDHSLLAFSRWVRKFDPICTRCIDYTPILRDVHTLMIKHNKPLSDVSWPQLQTYVHSAHGVLVDIPLLKKLLTNYIENETSNNQPTHPHKDVDR